MTDSNSTSDIFGAESDDPLANDPELRKELATMFLEDSPQQLSEIQAAMSAHDAPALKMTAHTIKGSIGVFKDKAAYETALRLEHVGRDSDWPAAEGGFQALRTEIARLTEVLKKLVSST
jgi:HPt (histidine-containing phosphotransfer) domain-containing protein